MTGSEVQICVEVAKALGASGTRARVVSMPCWELFEAQPEGYQLSGALAPLSLLTQVYGGYGNDMTVFRISFLLYTIKCFQGCHVLKRGNTVSAYN